jgi:hypothetical protein
MPDYKPGSHSFQGWSKECPTLLNLSAAKLKLLLFRGCFILASSRLSCCLYPQSNVLFYLSTSHCQLYTGFDLKNVSLARHFW